MDSFEEPDWLTDWLTKPLEEPESDEPEYEPENVFSDFPEED